MWPWRTIKQLKFERDTLLSDIRVLRRTVARMNEERNTDMSIISDLRHVIMDLHKEIDSLEQQKEEQAKLLDRQEAIIRELEAQGRFVVRHGNQVSGGKISKTLR